MEKKTNIRLTISLLVIAILMVLLAYHPGTSVYTIWAYKRLLHGDSLTFHGQELVLPRSQVFYRVADNSVQIVAMEFDDESGVRGLLTMSYLDDKASINFPSLYRHFADYCAEATCSWAVDEEGMIALDTEYDDREPMIMLMYEGCPRMITVGRHHLCRYQNIISDWRAVCRPDARPYTDSPGEGVTLDPMPLAHTICLQL